LKELHAWGNYTLAENTNGIKESIFARGATMDSLIRWWSYLFYSLPTTKGRIERRNLQASRRNFGIRNKEAFECVREKNKEI
jgi:hypothetical protein